LVEQLKSWVTDTLDRYGLPTMVLCVGGYLVWTGIIQPISEAYRKSIADIADINKSLKDEQVSNDKEDGERVRVITEHLQRIETKLDVMAGGLKK
jgi:hypothetical protein